MRPPPDTPPTVTRPQAPLQSTVQPPEPVVWSARPSPLVDIGFYLLLLLAALLGTLGLFVILPGQERGAQSVQTAQLFTGVLAGLWILVIILAIWRAVTRRAEHYLLTTQRLRVTSGVFSRTTDDLELRRVRDTRVVRSLGQRILRLGDVRLTTADPSTPHLTLHAVREPDTVQLTLRQLVEERIAKQGVREIDVY